MLDSCRRAMLLMGFILSLMVGSSVTVRAGDPGRLAFRQSGVECRFDTGVLKGTLHEGGKGLGLKSLRFKDTDTTVSGAYGIFSPYRLLTADARFGTAGWDWTSQIEILPNGGAKVSWQPDGVHPLAMTALYRWRTPDTLDLQVTVQPRRDLRKFEFFLATYFNGFPKAFAWSNASPGAAGGARFLEAVKSRGDWQTFPRDSEAAILFGDGRWLRPPNPVAWKIQPQLAAPLALRRDPLTGLTAVLMARPEDCFAVSMPQEEDPHRSVYLSLFGRDLKVGETAIAHARLVIGRNVTDAQAEDLYRAFLKNQEVEVKSAPPAVEVRANAGAPRKVLIVTGCDLHNWRETTPILVRALARDKRLEVSVTEDVNFLGRPELDRYHAIVLHYMNWKTAPPAPEVLEHFRKTVEGGTGLVLVHFACGAFQGWPDFVQIAGRIWNPKLRAHDPMGAFLVRITATGHPVTAPLKDFETTDELYTCLDGETPIHVVATARSKVDGKDYPMAFALNYGRGRVFHCVLGHDVRALDNAPVGQLFRRAAAWTAGLEP